MLTASLTGFLLATAGLVTSQEITSSQKSSNATATGAGGISMPSATGTGAPCAQISSLQASFASASPSATAGPLISANLANECAASVPIVKEDATQLIDGLLAMLEFQSDLEFLASPPSDYPFAGLDLLAEMKKLRDQVQADAFDGEIAFEGNLTSLLAKAHDGHLGFQPDGLAVFAYGSQFGPLVSVSEDGKALPKIYFLRDVNAYVNGSTKPSAVTQINGQDASEFALDFVVNAIQISSYQDLDAQYNSFFYSTNNGLNTGANPGAFLSFQSYPGQYTSVTFENGTHMELENYATTTLDFTDVVDGDSFYRSFLNASVKAASMSSASASATATSATASSSATVSSIRGYPSPIAIAEDGSLSGYFSEAAGFEDTAILAARTMTEEARESFQETTTKFLDACRKQKKKYLVLDLTGNPGGTVGLGYDLFKQLFPTLVPYGASNLRAHQGFELLGTAVTNISSTVMQQQPDNYTAFVNAGGTTVFAGTTFLNDSDVRFGSFGEFYGPVQASGDHGNYTNLHRLDLANPDYDETTSAIVISGYANESNLAPQPFESENIVLLTDGTCASTCSIFAHFMKWQGKVKSVAIGGRSQTGPMQAIGGIKGSQVMTFSQLFGVIDAGYSLLDEQTLSSWNGTSLATIEDNGNYLTLRTESAGENPTDLQFNVKNNIAEGDSSYTPLQYVYEAADCRLFYQPQHIYDISAVWGTVATQAFGLNGTTPWSLCVQGSTNQSSSLSGNATLYDDGNPTNVTDFIQENSTSSSSGGSGSSKSSAGSLRVSGALMLSAVIPAVLAFCL